MKNLLKVMALTLLMLMMTVNGVMAAGEANPYAPKDLTAVQMTADETHPYGSALLSFKITNLPRSTDSARWEVAIEKKIGAGEWTGVSGVPSETYLDTYQKSPGSFSFEQLWTEDYAWDGASQISYRVCVRHYDETWTSTGQSAYSNVASIGLVASPWAVSELKKAEALGLIPAILKGADMTRPITREEFAELATLLHEKVSGASAQPVSPNPFTDTANPQILKAFTLGIVRGIAEDRFEPKTLVSREQCAAMLFRTLKGLRPKGDYSVAGVKNFPDQKLIADYAVEATKYMAKTGIITGDAAGNFMPKATTSAQQAAGYGMATREQAVALAIRTYNTLK